MKKISIFFLIIFIISAQNLYAREDFNLWLKDFKKNAVKKGISEKTVYEVMKDVKFLPKVIEYDRYQPEFYEDTHTYINKRANISKVKKGLILYSKEKKIINKIESFRMRLPMIHKVYFYLLLLRLSVLTKLTIR